MNKNEKPDFDAVVVGSGPNGLAAAINLQREGYSTLLLESRDTIGGGLRSKELTLPGFVHDACSAIHPLAAGSPFFSTLPLKEHGLKFIYPEIPVAHPFATGDAAVVTRDIQETARLLGADEESYLKLVRPLAENWELLAGDILGPLRMPEHPVSMIRFAADALRSAARLSRRFAGRNAKGLWAGMAAHSILPLSTPATSAIALVLLATAHARGWPVAAGGSQRIADALGACFRSLGGTIETSVHVSSLSQLPSSRVVLFDVTPRQLLEIAGHQFSTLYRWQLSRFRHGMGVFKIDWALDGPIPFTAPECRKAGTVHLGNTFEEIAAGERAVWKGQHPEHPFVLLAQQSVCDPLRAPEGKQTAWAYCHVPNGSPRDMSEAIESQMERFAPGFRERILARHTMNSIQLQDYNPNYYGGDIAGGTNDLGQLFTRPALRWSPYRTSAKGLYLCSSSTPPGGGVHGMCGYHASVRAIRDILRHKE